MGPVLFLMLHAAAPPPVYLNHFYAVLDSAVYRKIEGNTELQDRFAVFERRTTTRTDRSYTGIYFYGESTYFELFDREGRGLGNSTVAGVAFGTDRAGDAEAILDDWKAAGLKPDEMPVTRGFEGRQIPWFHMFGAQPRAGNSAIDFWSMEYDPRFLKQWNPGLPPSAGLRRADILARYAAALQLDPSRKWMKDVTGLRIALDPADAARLAAEAGRLGWQVTPNSLRGPGIDIEFEPATPTARGIREVRFSLRGAPPKPIVYRFSSTCVLTLRPDATATWAF